MITEFHATPQEVMRAVETLQEFARARQVPEPVVFGLALALEECASNIVNHGYRGDASRTFRLTLEHADGILRVELRDQGPPFDPTAAARKAAPKARAEDHGGWGLGLLGRYTDELHYRRDAGENVLRFGRFTGKDDAQVK